jgi:broad specificity phosphatase PhoE
MSVNLVIQVTVVDPVVGPVHGDEALAKVLQGGLAGADLRLGQHHPDRPAWLVDHGAVLNLVLGLAEGMRARGRAANAQFRLLGHLDFGEQGARRRIPAGELDAGCLPDQAASAVAPDEVVGPQRLAVG